MTDRRNRSTGLDYSSGPPPVAVSPVARPRLARLAAVTVAAVWLLPVVAAVGLVGSFPIIAVDDGVGRAAQLSMIAVPLVMYSVWPLAQARRLWQRRHPERWLQLVAMCSALIALGNSVTLQSLGVDLSGWFNPDAYLGLPDSVLRHSLVAWSIVAVGSLTVARSSLTLRDDDPFGVGTERPLSEMTPNPLLGSGDPTPPATTASTG